MPKWHKEPGAGRYTLMPKWHKGGRKKTTFLPNLMPKWHSQNVYEPAVRADHHTPINRKGEFAMFYIKANGMKTSIESDNVFTYCPACGKKHYVDLFEILTGGGDLYSTAVYCLACSKKKDASASGKATNGPSESKRGNF